MRKLAYALLLTWISTSASWSNAAQVDLNLSCSFVFLSSAQVRTQSPTPTLEGRYLHGLRARAEFAKLIERIGQSTGATVIGPNVKGFKRYAEKAMGEYKGNANEVLDVNRAAFVASDLKHMKLVLDAIAEHGHIVRFRDRLTGSDSASPADIVLNVHLPASGEVAEIQVRHRLYNESYERAHSLYETYRSNPESPEGKAALNEFHKLFRGIHRAIEAESL